MTPERWLIKTGDENILITLNETIETTDQQHLIFIC